MVLINLRGGKLGANFCFNNLTCIRLHLGVKSVVSLQQKDLFDLFFFFFPV